MEQSKFYKIKNITEQEYTLVGCDGSVITRQIQDVDKLASVFTIQDAKDGDVLVNGSNIFIFHFLNDTRLMGYCHVNIDDGRFYDDLGKNECFCLIDAVVTPATKEQCDLLFSKMKEAGYEWDAEKKELKKIEQKPAWSEEDERMLVKIQDHLREFYVDKKGYPYVAESDSPEMMEYNWLKSLKERYTWKPSEEQMTALRRMKAAIAGEGEIYGPLNSLYEDLKNLKGE